MVVLGLPERDRMLEYDCIELLPDLEEGVLSADIVIPDIEESFISGLDDWWGGFVADMYL